MEIRKILANDGLAKESIELFNKNNIKIDTEKRDPEKLLKDISGFDGLIVRSATKVTKEIIEEGAKGELKIIGRAGVGYDNVDLGTATENGIIVKNAPHGNTNSTAELALGLMISISRNIPQAHNCLKKNKIWIKKAYKGYELSGKTLGIIGCGRVGQRLGELSQGFGMKVIGYDIIINLLSKIEYKQKEEVLKDADYISIHAGGKDTIIGEKELALMKPEAYLINTSRGKNIDEDALYTALEDKKIAGAALDVFVDEPKKDGMEFNKKLSNLENVIMTPHLGASTKEAQIKTSVEMANVIIDYFLKGDLANTVNDINSSMYKK